MQPVAARHCTIVTGPTCSGKSALAIALALKLDGVVINADSMQIYDGLRILTARPTDADEALVPHRLYGVRDAADAGSVAWWREAALLAMDHAWAGARLPILCGGTGMYLRALTDGLARIPDPGQTARTEARGLLAEIGAVGLHARLSEVDPRSAAVLRPSDGQRVCRAWEVWRGTGRDIASWSAEPGLPAAPCRFTAIRLSPPRPPLRAAIAERFASMLAQGALDEVRGLLARDLPPDLPAMRAHGVPQLAAHLAGTVTLADASARAIVLQGQYTRRQSTWFAHHPLATADRTVIIDKCMAGITQETEKLASDLIPFLLRQVDGSGGGA